MPDPGTVHLGGEDLSNAKKRIAAELRRLAESLDPAAQDEKPPARLMSALELARTSYAQRRRRERVFGDDLFADPAWDIMLDLFIAAGENGNISTSSACLGARVPLTTGLRWLRALEARGLVERAADPLDGRRTFLRLTADTHARMTTFLTGVAEGWGK